MPCDILITPIPDRVVIPKDTFLSERLAVYKQTTDPKTLAARVTVWEMLKEALSRFMGLSLCDLDPRREANGRWICSKAFFSLSHTEGFAAAAVSDRPVGLDLENRARFLERIRGREAAFSRRISAPDECLTSAEDVLRAWTVKEALYKRSGESTFLPNRFSSTCSNTLTLLTDTKPECILSVTDTDARIHTDIPIRLT